MLKSLKIKGFRQYADFNFENLGKINFIVGNNNSGKTSLLEAVYAWSCGENIVPLFFTPVSRARFSFMQNPYWLAEEVVSCFNVSQKSLTMSFEGEFLGNENQKSIEKFEHKVLLAESYKTLNHNFTQDEPKFQTENKNIDVQRTNKVNEIARWKVFHNQEKCEEKTITSPLDNISEKQSFILCNYVDILNHISVSFNSVIYSYLKRNNLLSEVTAQISKIYPEITAFDLLPYPDGSIPPISVYNKKDEGYLPLYAYGDGLQKWFYLLGLMCVSKNGIVCIDEIDNGFHPQSQELLCSSVINYALKNNVQLFMTSHNLEFLDYFVKAASKNKSIIDNNADDIRIITLKKIDDEIKVRNLSIKDAMDARFLYNMDLR